ncbi:MAG: cytochrome c-type biogenesis protein CcmH [Desulfitobacteriaceae bacterium]|nr:cytochrome c-type biogenesis protein CcmH [Desulfitobacteriaceae bacterium]MDI6913536.1 cytochrome c-type biogenesis protein CcmH [Desulfitobacteriaceae bacterium]
MRQIAKQKRIATQARIRFKIPGIKVSKEKKAVTLLMLLLFLVMFLIPAIARGEEEWQTRPIPSDVEKGVVCVLDGCMMNLAVCETPAAEKLRGIIREKMFKDGLTQEQTYAYLAEVYGDKVLAAPPKRGFNWVAWLGPFVALMGGGALVYLRLEKWVSSSWQGDEPEEATSLNPEAAQRLDQELKKYL